jgi:hypothetical protein
MSFSNISPGVYTKIIDLSTYVQQVPGTIGCICALTKKGEDNKFKLLTSQGDLLKEFGEPNIEDYGKDFSQGPYIAYNFLGESGSMFFLRCMPDDAAYANIRIDATYDATAEQPVVSTSYISTTSANTKLELQGELETDGDTTPLCILYPIGRGEFYNEYAVRLTSYANPMKSGIYNLDLYEVQSDDSEVIIESLEISFDPKSVDSSGGSLFIEDVLERYSNVLRAMVTKIPDQNGISDYSDGYKLLVKVYDKNIGSIEVSDKTDAEAFITDTKQNFNDWCTVGDTGTAEYIVIAKNGRGDTMYGWLGDVIDEDGESVKVFNSRFLDTASQEWTGSDGQTSINNFYRVRSGITYEIKKSFVDIATGFQDNLGNDLIKSLKKGSDGTLISGDGTIDSTVATQCLVDGYSGTLVSPHGPSGTLVSEIKDTEFIYYSLLFDAGYPTNVKTCISSLAVDRMDCIAIMDNGDNQTCDDALDVRSEDHTYNNFYTSLYEPFNKVNDIFTGRDIWVSPMYHMAYVLPRNDRVSEVWFAAAGFDYVLDSIKELRYSPNQGQRDQMYLKQLNPFVKFREGIVPYGQLTSQSKPSAMQDINVVRLVLYCKVALERYCRYYVFKMNDSDTWEFINRDVSQFLGEVQKARGVYSFSVDVGATEYEKKMKKLHVNVILNPTRVAEKIELNFFIQ